VVVWHAAQSVGKAAAVWFGFVVAVYLARWHETHVVAFPLYTPSLWHFEQVVVRCAPVSGNRVLA
jgi:hypothetical protein